MENELSKTTAAKENLISDLKDKLQSQTSIDYSLEQQVSMTLTIKKVRNDRNGLAWPTWIDKIIFHKLVAGARPSAMPEK